MHAKSLSFLNKYKWLVYSTGYERVKFTFEKMKKFMI